MCLILCLVRGLKVQLSVWIKGACMEHLSQLLMLQSLWHAGLNGMVLCFEAVRQLGLGCIPTGTQVQTLLQKRIVTFSSLAVRPWILVSLVQF